MKQNLNLHRSSLYHTVPYIKISTNCNSICDTNNNTTSIQVRDEAKFFVHSTCACNFTMYHEVMARGNVVHSGIHYARAFRRKRSVQFDTELPGGIRFDDDLPGKKLSYIANLTLK